MKVTRAIILAAGMGTRLGDKTKNSPKCMVSIHGKTLIHWQLEALNKAGIKDIIIVGGYKIEKLRDLPAIIVENPEYSTTNMVRSLLCARRYFDKDFIMVYGDILYSPQIINHLMNAEQFPAVVVDKNWRNYWEMRFDNVLDDAESMEVNNAGNISSIGQIISDPDKINGQYIGMVYFNKESINQVLDLLEQEQSANLKGEKLLCQARNLDKLFITDLLQGLINTGVSVIPVWTKGGWLEIDNEKDLKIAEKLTNTKEAIININR